MFIKPLIQFCLPNLPTASQPPLQKLQKHPNLHLMHYASLPYSPISFQPPFPLLNAQVLQRPTVQHLLNNLYHYFDQNPIF
nr:DUF1450 domain-containing protein [Bacillus thuringiensis]